MHGEALEGSHLYIPTAQLLLHSPGIECAARPLLYPTAAYLDSATKERYGGAMTEGQRPSAKGSYLRKVQSLCMAYATDFMLLFLISDIATARQTMAKISVAENRGLTPDVRADNKQNGESYWLHEQDILCDVVRQMGLRCEDQLHHRELYDYCHPFNGTPRSLSFPNVFMTIAPGKWVSPSHYAIFQRWKRPKGYTNPKDLHHVAGLFTLRIYNVLMCALRSLFVPDDYFEKVIEYVVRTEFQGRGTLHLHIAM